jgi:hypothetical protein
MNRRDFVTTGLTAVTGAALLSCDGTRTATSTATAAAVGIDFDFTGLYAFRLNRSQKDMFVVLPSASKVGLNDQHAPMLTMPWDAYEPHPKDTNGTLLRPHDAPTVYIHGGMKMATWSLFGLKIWLSDAHATFSGADANASLKYNEDPIGTDPNPIDADSGWASLKWFAPLTDMLGGLYQTGAKTPTFDERKYASQIRLTRGDASGRAPLFACEQKRKYKIASGGERTFAKQMHVVYPAAAGTQALNLAFVNIDAALLPGYIGVKMMSGGPTPVAIGNLPLTHSSNEHYKAFYALVNDSGQDISFVEHCTGLTPHGAMAGALTTTSEPNSPDPDCIPPSDVRG